ncbi:MAG: DUF2029 domain-containing protein [Candidatus Viridilinea halotolerans]|uniref:DUF2029 domain-containing protein n=1 Tax=Candidatus Viridilinea halotolerans TaxID=2491704 RepID=A0A426UBT6_9CHLR|nr:MAG: DUF2029 domain-containing protein [Candidatus Viridilinea halotolerans]
MATYSKELGIGLLAALMTLFIFGGAYARAWPLVATLGLDDQWFVAGFYGPEEGEIGPFRWSDGDAKIFMPRPALGRTVKVDLQIIDARANPEAPRELILRADGEVLTQFMLDHGQLRNYALLIPPEISFTRDTTIRLVSDGVPEFEGGRVLGVAVNQVRLTPIGAGVLWPNLWLAGHALIFGLLSYSVGRLSGVRHGSAFLITGGAALLIGGLIATKPMDTLPYLHRFTLLGAVFCVGIMAVRRLFLPVRSQRDAAPMFPGRYLPIMLGIGSWCALLLQAIIIWDGATNIGSPQWVRTMGLVVAVGIVGIWVWRASSDRQLPLEQRQSQVARPILLILAGAALLNIGWGLTFAFSREAPDLLILYRGAQSWLAGGSFYDLEAVLTNHFGHVFKVPPFYGMFFVPLVDRIDATTTLLLHRIMNTLLIGATALVWLRMWRIPLWSLTAAGLLILLDFRPLFDTLAFGQIDIVLLFLLTLALWALREERDGVAGALVAAGTLLKIYPLILLAFFVLKGRWRALGGFVLGMVILNGLAIAAIGWEEHRIYLFDVLPSIGGTTPWIENQTISGFIARLGAPATAAAIFHNPLLEMIGTGLSALVVLAALALTLRPATVQSSHFALQYSLFLLLMVLTVPTAWMHYQTLLLVPFATLVLHFRERQITLGMALLLGISFGLIAFGNQWSFQDREIVGLLSVLGVSYKFYGMLILAGVMGAVCTRRV